MRVNSVVLDHQKKTAAVEVFVDATTDITDSTPIPGVPEGYTIDEGSSVITAEGDFAFRKSDGTWNWL